MTNCGEASRISQRRVDAACRLVCRAGEGLKKLSICVSLAPSVCVSKRKRVYDPLPLQRIKWLIWNLKTVTGVRLEFLRFHLKLNVFGASSSSVTFRGSFIDSDPVMDFAKIVSNYLLGCAGNLWYFGFRTEGLDPIVEKNALNHEYFDMFLGALLSENHSTQKDRWKLSLSEAMYTEVVNSICPNSTHCAISRSSCPGSLGLTGRQVLQ